MKDNKRRRNLIKFNQKCNQNTHFLFVNNWCFRITTRNLKSKDKKTSRDPKKFSHVTYRYKQEKVTKIPFRFLNKRSDHRTTRRIKSNQRRSNNHNNPRNNASLCTHKLCGSNKSNFIAQKNIQLSKN